jgi:hypothetical protein
VSKGKERALSCLLVLFGVTIAGLIGEAALRAGGYSPVFYNPLHSFHEAHSLVGYRGKPNFVGRFRRPEFDVVIAHDEKGFRRHEHDNRDAAIRHRLFVFGDSFTWGWGVGQGKVFTDRMSRLMSDYRIMNLGLNASGTVEQFTMFEAYSQEMIQPGDTVILLFDSTDFSDNLNGYVRGVIKDGRVIRVGPLESLGENFLELKHKSYLVNFVIYSADVIKARIKRARSEERATELVRFGASSPEIVVTRYFLSQFQESLAAKNGRFVVVYIPRQGELDESVNSGENFMRRDQGFRQALFACAESVGVQIIDLLPHLLAAKESGLYQRMTFEYDAHWNENGHAVAAKVLADFILAADKR